MNELSYWQIMLVIYTSLWLAKLFIVSADMRYVAQVRVDLGRIETPSQYTKPVYAKIVYYMYMFGASIALGLLLIPSLLTEGLHFFTPYDKEDLDYFADTGEWPGDES